MTPLAVVRDLGQGALKWIEVIVGFRGGELHSGGSAAQERDHVPGVGGRGRALLVVLVAETGGRWSFETAQFLQSLAKKAETDHF